MDTIAPIISLHGDANITHEAGTAYHDTNASWSDLVDGAGVIVASGEVNASDPGTYVLSYHYTDASGNAALTATRTVHVVDTIAPIISLHGDANITHEAGSAYVDANASWSDLVDGAGVILASGEVNASVPGIYMLFYNYTDASGNEAETRVRAVEVLNFAPDGLSVLGDLNLTVFENEANGTVVATFAGTDPNADNMLSYMLIDTVEQNATDSLLLPFFQLDENGTLLTLRSSTMKWILRKFHFLCV